MPFTYNQVSCSLHTTSKRIKDVAVYPTILQLMPRFPSIAHVDDAVVRYRTLSLLDAGSCEHLGGNGRSKGQQQLLELLSGLVRQLSLLCRLQHVAKQGQEVGQMRLDDVLTLFKEQEDGVEDGLVLDEVLGQWQTTEPKGKNLIQRQGGVVLEDHSSDAAGSVVLGVDLIGGRGVVDLEEGGKRGTERTELGSQVDLGPFDQGTSSECGI